MTTPRERADRLMDLFFGFLAGGAAIDMGPSPGAGPSSVSSVEREAPPRAGRVPKIATMGCEYGVECVKNHLLRAHLFMAEALRFTGEGPITPEAQAKVRLAREQLLCEDDFAQALAGPDVVRLEMLRLLAATRGVWKAIETSGVDMGRGSAEDLLTVAVAIQDLSDTAYGIDRQLRDWKEKNG